MPPAAAAAQHRDENGEQARVSPSPVTLTLTYASDANADVAGGARRGAAYLQRLGGIADVDLDPLIGWRGAALHASVQAIHGSMLVAPGDAHVVTKKSLDGFLDTDLDFMLRRVYGAETVVLAGINTDTCVYATAFSASNRGYQTVVISDCVASMRGKDHHWMALELMSRSIAWVLTLEEFKDKLRAR